MCIAATSTIPSATPLFLTTAATSSVMRMNCWRCLVLNQRYSVSVFMVFLQRETGVGVEVGQGGRAGSISPKPGGRNHRRIIGRERQAGNEHRDAALVAADDGVGAQPRVGRHAAGDADAARVVPPRGIEQPIEQVFNRHALEAGADMGDLVVRQ